MTSSVPILAWLLVQGATSGATSTAPPPPSATASASAEESWEFSGDLYLYLLGDDSYLLPMVTADRGPLHLEARWNYEAFDSLSLWAGRNVEVEGAVSLEVTPMLGLVLGDEPGFGPGIELALEWSKLDLWTECELIVSADDPGDSFFYAWSELGYSALDWLRLGVSAQRTRVFDTSGVAEFGPMVEVSTGPVSLQAYGYSLFGEDAYWLVGVSVDF